jgi:succinyl-CoA synthetase beta subunit
LKTSDNKILAVDAKVNIDDNAYLQTKAYAEMRDVPENQSVEAKEVGNHVDLKVGIVTVKKHYGFNLNAGFEPANSSYVGGTLMQNAETAFALIQAKAMPDQYLEESFVIVLLKELLMLTKHGDAIKVPIIVRTRYQCCNCKGINLSNSTPILSAVEFQLTKLKQSLNYKYSYI